MSDKKWTEDEDIYLEYFISEGDTNLSEAAAFLKRSYNSVASRCDFLRRNNPELPFFNRKWTKKEDDFIRAHYQSLTYKNISTRLNRSVQAVDYRIRYLGLKKTKALKEYDEEIRILANKGCSYSEIARELNLIASSVSNYAKKNNINVRKLTKSERDEIRRKNFGILNFQRIN